jgi:hypothetical protein
MAALSRGSEIDVTNYRLDGLRVTLREVDIAQI